MRRGVSIWAMLALCSLAAALAMLAGVAMPSGDERRKPDDVGAHAAQSNGATNGADAVAAPAGIDVPATDTCELREQPGIGRACRVGHMWKVRLDNGTDAYTHGGHETADLMPSTDAAATAPINATSTDKYCTSSGRRYQVIYALPTLLSSSFSGTVEGKIRWSVLQSAAKVNMTAKLVGKLARLRVECTSGGAIAVTRVRLPINTRTDGFGPVVNALQALGYDDPDVNYLIYYDNPVADAGAGTATVGGRPGYAAIWGGNVEYWHAYLHEVTHNLGAVWDDAPYSSRRGHCIDGHDIMCYDDSEPHILGKYTETRCSTKQYDCGRDTYFNAAPKIGNWLYLRRSANVYFSPFFQH